MTAKLIIPADPKIYGTEDQWQNGFLYSDYIAGRLEEGPCTKVFTDCPQCPTNTPEVGYVVVSGWAGPGSAALNGTFPCRYQGNCIWVGDPIPGPGAYRSRWTFRIVDGQEQLYMESLYPPGFGPTWSWDVGIPDWSGRGSIWVAGQGGALGALTAPSYVVWGDSPYGDEKMSFPGMLFAVAGSSAPAGSVLCDGTAYPTGSPYDRLYAMIGNTWDTFRGQVAPGEGLFRVPLLNGLVIAASGSAVSSGVPVFPTTDSHSPGDLVGADSGPIALDQLPTHSHGLTDPGHSHNLADPGHNHPLSDPGHAHYPNDGADFHTSNPLTNFTTGAGSTPIGTVHYTHTGYTGISLANAVTGLSAASAQTGLAVQSSGMSSPLDRRQPTVYAVFCIAL
jgi:microcystin-dependent protein